MYYLDQNVILDFQPIPGINLLDYFAVNLNSASYLPALVSKGLQPSDHVLFLTAYKALLEEDIAMLRYVTGFGKSLVQIASPAEAAVRDAAVRVSPHEHWCNLLLNGRRECSAR
jgi:hypothetical protein